MFKISLLTYNSLHKKQPAYLHTILAASLPSCSLRSNKGISRSLGWRPTQVQEHFTLVPLLLGTTCSCLSIQPFQLLLSKNISRHTSLTWPLPNWYQHTRWPIDVTKQLHRSCCWTPIRLSHHQAWLRQGYWYYTHLIDWFFNKFHNIRIKIDCTELFYCQARNFTDRETRIPAIKTTLLLKNWLELVQVGLSVSYLMLLKVRSVIVVQSGLLEILDSSDLVLADRGLTIKDILNAKGVDWNIPSFLRGRSRLTLQEDMETKHIAKSRIHVERATEHLKKSTDCSVSVIKSNIFEHAICLWVPRKFLESTC